MQKCETALHVLGKGKSYCIVVCVGNEDHWIGKGEGDRESVHAVVKNLHFTLWVMEKPVCVSVCVYVCVSACAPCAHTFKTALLTCNRCIINSPILLVSFTDS